MHTGVVHPSSGQWRQVFGGEDREKSPELAPGHTAPCTNCLHTAASCTEHISEVAELALYIKGGVLERHTGERSAINRTSLSLASQTVVPGVFTFQWGAYATALLFPMDVHATAGAWYGWTVNTFPTYSTSVLSRVFQQVQPRPRDHNLGLFHVHPESLLFHLHFPEPQALLALLQ